jgi:hypothetical protein
MEKWRRSGGVATVLAVDLNARGTYAPGLRLVLLAALLSMALTADMSLATAAPAAVRPGLLDFDPVRPLWAGRRAKRGDGAAASRALPPHRSRSAALPALAYEPAPGPAP